MPETRLQDVIVPEHFADYSMELTTEMSRFRRSGIAVDFSKELGDKMGGVTVNMPYFNDLQGDDEVVDDTQDLQISSIGASQDIAVKLYRAKSFGASDLSGDLAGADPVKAIAVRFAEYWIRREQEILISACKGALSVATMSDNVLDITGLVGAAANFDPFSFIDAQARLGDHQDMLSGIACHSKTYTAMKKADLIEEIRPSDGGDPIPTYMGKVLIVDDKMPADAGNYTTFIFGQGAVGYVQASPKVPVEVGREPLKGGGQDYIVQRRWVVMHPRGIRWSPQAGVPAKATPSNAELGAANWQRCYDPKNIRIVMFKHKIG